MSISYKSEVGLYSQVIPTVERLCEIAMSDNNLRSRTPPEVQPRTLSEVEILDGNVSPLIQSPIHNRKHSKKSDKRKRKSKKGKKSKKKLTKKRRNRQSSSSSSSSTFSDSSDSSTDTEHKKRKNRKRHFKGSVSFMGQFNAGDEKMIPTFDPQRSEQSIETWVRRVDDLARVYGWDDLTVVKLVANRLVGMARRWYDSQDQLTLNWNSIKTLLIKQFSKPLPFAKLLREAALYETYSGQDLSEYCFNKLDKLKSLKLNIPESYLVDAIIGGITNENIARSARSSRFTDTNELYAYLSALGCLPRTPKTEIPRKIAVSVQSQVSKVTTSQKPELLCFNCKGPHRARDCPKPRLECFNCKRLGHKQNKCPGRNPKQIAGKSDNVSEIVQVKNTNNPYIMNVVLNGKKYKCLVDTGSSCTLIRRCVSENLGLEVQNNNIQILKSFTGNSITSAGTVNVHVRLGQPSAMLNVIVVNDSQMTHDCIVGRDFIDLPNVMLLKIGMDVTVRELSTNIKPVCDFECFEIGIKDEDKINYGEITDKQRLQCEDLLSEFSDRISKCMSELGKTDAAKMEIKMLTDEPVVYRPYRLPLAEKEILRGIIDELLCNNIIRESTSAYSSPVLLVKKKTGDVRMCVDYRRLNALIVKDQMAFPLIDEQLDLLGKDEHGDKYEFFTALDLASGFYQVPMDENSIDKTAFITPDSHYEFLRMPFGLCNAPSVFQRLMNNVLGSLKNKIAFPYMDDVIIPSTTVEEGLRRLRLVFEAFRKHNLTIKLSKCSFFHKQIDYLGREISADGIKPGKRKIEAILRMDEPKTVKQVRQFLGLSGYFRKFVKNYSGIVEPLTRLTRKDSKWCWQAEQQEAFKTVKAALVSRPVLAIFDHSLPTELHTDASSSAVAAILFQTHDGVQRVVAYFSKKTTIDQRQYHSYELETMAVVYALHHFRVYLLGINFTVITDCSAIKTAFSKKDLLPRIGRWWLQVQEFTFDIKHRPGTRMPHVDALSRLPIVDGIDINQVDITEGDWIKAAQMQDEQLSRIHKILKVAEKNSETKQYFREYELKDEKLYRKLQDGRKLWAVPKLARWQILKLCHDKAGHMGVENTLKRIQLNYWFPKMRRFVTKYINACLNCAYYKNTTIKNRGKLHPIEKQPIPFHTIHLDHVGPFETSKSGNKFLLVIVDGFTKFTIIEAVKSTKVKPVIRALQTAMCIFGVPARIISDRGTAFTSKTFRIFCESYAIKHILNAVASPRSNGQCERYNGTIVNMLATTSVEDKGDTWDLHVKNIQSALNTSFNKSINTTPVQALFGYQTRPMAEGSLLNSLQTVVDRINISELRDKVKDHITQDQQRQKARYDKHRREAERFQVGDLVRVLITSYANTGVSKKLLPKFKGPFRVVKVLFNDRYELEDLREGARRRNIRMVVAADKLQKWITLMKI